jgi:hypothetical protein
MIGTSRPLFVLAAAVPVTLLAGLASIGEAATPPRAAASAASSPGPAIVLAHLQQQLTRVTGVPEVPQHDVEALGRALLAARTRPAQPERVTELASVLATALSHGIVDEVLMQRLAEDLFAALNNRELTKEQAGLLAIDVVSVLQDATVQEQQTALVMAALRRVCPEAIAPAQYAEPGTPQDEAQHRSKRALLVLSRGSSE